MESIGIFGGTFDPPHIGHLILAAEARAEFGLERLLWMLTQDPPHKQGQQVTTIEHRQAMVKLAIEKAPEFELSTVEIDRPGPHYAVDTVKILKARYPQTKMVYLMGGDSLHDLPNWHHPEEFVQLCDSIGVLRRPQDNIDMSLLEEKLPEISAKICFMNAPLLDISAHDIRARIAAGRPFRYYLPPKVYSYIIKNQLYSKSMKDLRYRLHN